MYSSVFPNLVKTAVKFESKTNLLMSRSVHEAGARAALIIRSESSNKKVTVCTSVACSGNKLNLDLNIRGQTERSAKRSFKDLLPGNIYNWCQSKSWIDSCAYLDGESVDAIHGCILKFCSTARLFCLSQA